MMDDFISVLVNVVGLVLAGFFFFSCGGYIYMMITQGFDPLYLKSAIQTCFLGLFASVFLYTKSYNVI